MEKKSMNEQVSIIHDRSVTPGNEKEEEKKEALLSGK
jgi:hypothetical protein